ncbi:MAG: type II secretion system major pseudopilin GspG [Opitutaceae bacterium]|nr:type II secretion system major pseudopilin GspG [Opitutaceae bacterium]
MMKPHRNSPARTGAFTLIEILVVVAIIGMLAALFITNTDKIFGQSQDVVARVFVRDSLKTSLTRYRIDTGDYPTTAEGLQALVSAPANSGERWQGPYVELTGGRLPLDPWNEPYQYIYPGTRNKGGYDLFSKGPDKTAGTEDDIGNW